MPAPASDSAGCMCCTLPINSCAKRWGLVPRAGASASGRGTGSGRPTGKRATRGAMRASADVG